jgi:hypothetical protein
LLTEWPLDDHTDREKLDRARRNAEDLFKPRPQSGPADATAAAENSIPSPAEHPPPRQPRIFRIPPVVPMSAAKGEAPAEPKPMRRQRTVRRDARTIPASQFGRIRALASYGMTQAQVAELYGVGVDEIERIIRQSNSTRIA